MKNLEVGLNILHYCICKFHYKSHLLFNKINPLWFLVRLPVIKTRHEQLGVNFKKEFDQAWSNETNGLSVTAAGGVLLGILSIFVFGFNDGIYHIMNLNTNLSAINYIAFFGISFVTCYWFVFKEDKYLLYFKEFKKWTRSENRKYGWISFIFIVSVIALFFITL